MSKPIDEKRQKKNIKLSIPRGPQRWAFYQAFQPFVNYSRQRRRTRTLSAITLHSSLPSVSNINVMAFIFSSRLWTREASLKSALSLTSCCQSIYDICGKKKKEKKGNVLWWPVPGVGIYSKHAGINASLCTFWWGCVCSLGVWGFILPVVFQLTHNLDLVKDDSAPVLPPTCSILKKKFEQH